MIWHTLGDVNYRKWHVHQMAWNVEVSEALTAGAQAGGPLALVPRDRVWSQRVPVSRTFFRLGICTKLLSIAALVSLLR